MDSMKRDAYNFVDRWEAWKEKNYRGIDGIRKEDHALLISFLKDMEMGINTPVGRKGRRNAGTLLNLAQHNLLFLQLFKKPLTQLKKEDLHKLEEQVLKGKIERKKGGNFAAFGNYIKDLKVFWRWLIRVGKVKEDITADISSKVIKPAWVYLSEEQIKQFFNKLQFDYRALCFLMYDSGMRVTELNSIQVKNFSKDFSQLDIPDEVSKTFGRCINLKLCTDLIKTYVKEHQLKADDYIMTKSPFAFNKMLKYNCGKMFGKDKVSHPKSKGLYGSFTLYDIRHNSACFWLQRYPTQQALMYRFGWKESDKIDYYSGFLGQSDKLTDGDMVIGEDKDKITLLSREVQKMKEDKEELKQGIFRYLADLLGREDLTEAELKTLLVKKVID